MRRQSSRSSSTDAALRGRLHNPGQAAKVGFAAPMEAPSAADEFIPAGLSTYGIEADEIELAVIQAAHQTFWPPILELLALDTSGVPAERDPDLSQPPRR